MDSAILLIVNLLIGLKKRFVTLPGFKPGTS